MLGKIFRALLTLVASVALAGVIIYAVTGVNAIDVLTGKASLDGHAPAATSFAAPKPTSGLGSYDWATLSKISSEIAAAPTDEEAAKVAKSYGLLTEDGRLTDEPATFTMADGTEFHALLVGIRHDDRADGKGKAGLTFMTAEAVALRPMNSNGDNAGGWEQCEMRSWLNGDELKGLPEDLRSVVVPVAKKTNNSGGARDASAVTATNDSLWLFSTREVCGDIDWYSHEYGADFAWLDDVANAEGTQYQRFSAAGVASRTAPDGVLVRTFQGKKVCWSYRTPFYYVYENLDGRFFYDVMDTGYPYAYAEPAAEQGVVFGFCV